MSSIKQKDGFITLQFTTDKITVFFLFVLISLNAIMNFRQKRELELLQHKLKYLNTRLIESESRTDEMEGRVDDLDGRLDDLE